MNRRSRFCRPMPYHLAMSPRKFLLERETGFEPATSTLARLHSTTELLPRGVRLYIEETPPPVNKEKGEIRKFFLFRKKCASGPAGTKKPGAAQAVPGWGSDKHRLIQTCFQRPGRLRSRRPASFLLLHAGRGGAPCPRASWGVRRGIRRRGAPCRRPASRGRTWRARQC